MAVERKEERERSKSIFYFMAGGPGALGFVVLSYGMQGGYLNWVYLFSVMFLGTCAEFISNKLDQVIDALQEEK